MALIIYRGFSKKRAKAIAQSARRKDKAKIYQFRVVKQSDDSYIVAQTRKGIK